jgi:hypothetical protein
MRGGARVGLIVVLAGAALIATGAAIAILSDGDRPSEQAARPSGAPARMVAAQARADAFAEVARRIYDHEHAPVVARSTVKHLAQNLALLRALRTGNRAAIRAQARRPVIPHEVRVRIVRGSRVLMDAGLPFVVQAAQGELLAPDGADLGRVQVSIQDVIGYVKLVHRQTGTEVVVRGQAGRVATSLPAATRARLPVSGTVRLAGRPYIVRSFKVGDFVGKPLTVWVLDRLRSSS